jgi:hypothetical protein
VTYTGFRLILLVRRIWQRPYLILIDFLSVLHVLMWAKNTLWARPSHLSVYTVIQPIVLPSTSGHMNYSCSHLSVVIRTVYRTHWKWRKQYVWHFCTVQERLTLNDDINERSNFIYYLTKSFRIPICETNLKMKLAVFWVVVPCSLVDVYRPIALMMEAASTSETSVNFYQTTRCYNPEDSHLHTRNR